MRKKKETVDKFLLIKELGLITKMSCPFQLTNTRRWPWRKTKQQYKVLQQQTAHHVL